jgi:hypothetical protein
MCTLLGCNLWYYNLSSTKNVSCDHHSDHGGVTGYIMFLLMQSWGHYVHSYTPTNTESLVTFTLDSALCTCYKHSGMTFLPIVCLCGRRGICMLDEMCCWPWWNRSCLNLKNWGAWVMFCSVSMLQHGAPNMHHKCAAKSCAVAILLYHFDHSCHVANHMDLSPVNRTDLLFEWFYCSVIHSTCTV